MDLFANLATGFSAAASWQNVGFALIGCLLGTLIGVLPGIGPIPTILSGIIVVIGAIVGLKSLAVEGPPIEPVKLRPLLFILCAIVGFGYLIGQIGLALSAAGLAVFAAYARDHVNLKETVVLAVFLSAFAVGVFAYALGQPLPIWWGS